MYACILPFCHCEALEIVKNSNEFLKNNPHKGEARQSKPVNYYLLKN